VTTTDADGNQTQTVGENRAFCTLAEVKDSLNQCADEENNTTTSCDVASMALAMCMTSLDGDIYFNNFNKDDTLKDPSFCGLIQKDLQLMLWDKTDAEDCMMDMIQVQCAVDHITADAEGA